MKRSFIFLGLLTAGCGAASQIAPPTPGAGKADLSPAPVVAEANLAAEDEAGSKQFVLRLPGMV
jgi:hypothetical protein